MIRYRDDFAMLYAGDCVEVMASMPEASVDAIVTDPPYGLEFMGNCLDNKAHMRLRRADELSDPVKAKYLRHSVEYVGGAGAQAWHEQWARAALRILKPGGHILAFGGSRTYHRLACAIEDAGFEVRDCLMWLYGSGFPKSLDVSKAIDKAAGIWRGRAGEVESTNGAMSGPNYERTEKGDPVTAAASAAAWSGWGTALKPAHEPIILARKPLAGTVAENVLAHGTGALNVDGCRIGHELVGWQGAAAGGGTWNDENCGLAKNGAARPVIGRWPANVLLDEEAARLLDEQSGELTSGANPTRRGADTRRGAYGAFAGQSECEAHRGQDTGGASRFFYTAKADAEDRDGSKHPTVKPVDLMKWLIRLVTPPEGVVLDPFLGSGTTVYAARSLGIKSIGIEREPAYLEDAVRRLRQGQLL